MRDDVVIRRVANQFRRQQQEEPMCGGSDGGGAPTPMAEETAI